MEADVLPGVARLGYAAEEVMAKAVASSVRLRRRSGDGGGTPPHRLL